MLACGYEFYLLVFEDKIRIHAQACNPLSVYIQKCTI